MRCRPWSPLLGFAAVAWQRLGQTVLSHRGRKAALSEIHPESGAYRAAVADSTRTRTVCVALIVVLATGVGVRAICASAVRIASRFEKPPYGSDRRFRIQVLWPPRSFAWPTTRGAPYVPLGAGCRRFSRSHSVAWGGASFVIVDGNRLDRHPGLSEGIGQWLREIHSVRTRRTKGARLRNRFRTGALTRNLSLLRRGDGGSVDALSI